MIIYFDRTEEIYVKIALEEAYELARRTNLAETPKEIERSKCIQEIYEGLLKKMEENK